MNANLSNIVKEAIIKILSGVDFEVDVDADLVSSFSVGISVGVSIGISVGVSVGISVGVSVGVSIGISVGVIFRIIVFSTGFEGVVLSDDDSRWSNIIVCALLTDVAPVQSTVCWGIITITVEAGET